MQPGFHGFKVPRVCLQSAILGYVDDILIFTSASAASLKRFNGALEKYESVSSRIINVSKSGFMVYSRRSRSRRALIQRIIGFSHKKFPICYLGYPLIEREGRRSISKSQVIQWLQGLGYRKIDCCHQEVRLCLLNVLSFITIHLLAATPPPNSVFATLNFLLQLRVCLLICFRVQMRVV